MGWDSNLQMLSRLKADGPSHLLQPLQKRRVAGLHLRVARRPGHERTHAPHLLALLRSRRERPRRRTAEEGEELAPFHCPMSPVLRTDRIAHLGTAADCCAGDFEQVYVAFGVRFGPVTISARPL
jgi:hypothetical protein